jgi:hypothetical protein
MERIAVSSSSIKAVAFDPQTLTLEIEFIARGTYQYFDVPEFLYRGLLVARSKGAFFNSRIHDRYRCTELP